MFQITHNKKDNLLEVKNTSQTVYAQLFLDKGASLQKLKLSNTTIIEDLSPLDYSNTYASSILFPFANRIKDGKYNFNGNDFEFPVNVKEENNALHGLVFDKTFELINTELNEQSATIVLEYEKKTESVGFPYSFTIQLVYCFTEDNMSLEINVKNTDTKAFPFTLGWHPYFSSSNLSESNIKFDATEKMILDKRNITIDSEKVDTSKGIAIKNNQFDDCWSLQTDEVVFTTPEYKLQFNATGNNNFLQVYTPPKKNTIAIEQTTGVSDSFNNKIGLKVLNANDTYGIKWSLHIENI